MLVCICYSKIYKVYVILYYAYCSKEGGEKSLYIFWAS